jgi:hypothetical protein
LLVDGGDVAALAFEDEALRCVDDEDVGDRQQRRAGGKEQRPVQQRQAQPNGTAG